MTQDYNPQDAPLPEDLFWVLVNQENLTGDHGLSWIGRLSHQFYREMLRRGAAFLTVELFQSLPLKPYDRFLDEDEQVEATVRVLGSVSMVEPITINKVRGHLSCWGYSRVYCVRDDGTVERLSGAEEPTTPDPPTQNPVPPEDEAGLTHPALRDIADDNRVRVAEQDLGV